MIFITNAMKTKIGCLQQKRQNKIALQLVHIQCFVIKKYCAIHDFCMPFRQDLQGLHKKNNSKV